MPAENKPQISLTWTLLGIVVLVGLIALLVLRPDPETDGRMGVYGRVTLNGEDLAAGQIFLTPTSTSDGPATAGRIFDGEYRISSEIGPVAGEYEVRITTGEPGPPGGLNRSESENSPEPRVSYFFTCTLSESSREQNFILTPDARQRRRPR